MDRKDVTVMTDRELLEETVSGLRKFEDAIANFDPSVVIGALSKSGGMGAILGAMVQTGS